MRAPSISVVLNADDVRNVAIRHQPAQVTKYGFQVPENVSITIGGLQLSGSMPVIAALLRGLANQIAALPLESLEDLPAEAGS